MGLEAFLMHVNTQHEVVNGAAKLLPPMCQESASPSREVGRKTEHPIPGSAEQGATRVLAWGEFCCGTGPPSHLRKESAEVPLRIPQALGRAEWPFFPEANGTSAPAGKGWGMVRHDTLIL